MKPPLEMVGAVALAVVLATPPAMAEESWPHCWRDDDCPGFFLTVMTVRGDARLSVSRSCSGAWQHIWNKRDARETMSDDLYAIPQELLDFRQTIGQIVAERVAPRAAEIDETSEYPRDIRELFSSQDILALPFPERYGGTGTGTLMQQMAVEEVAKACASSALILSSRSAVVTRMSTGASNTTSACWGRPPPG